MSFNYGQTFNFPYGFKAIITNTTGTPCILGFVDPNTSAKIYFDPRNSTVVSSITNTLVGFCTAMALTAAPSAQESLKLTGNGVLDTLTFPIGKYVDGTTVIPQTNLTAIDYSNSASTATAGAGITGFSSTETDQYFTLTSLSTGTLLLTSNYPTQNNLNTAILIIFIGGVLFIFVVGLLLFFLFRRHRLYGPRPTGATAYQYQQGIPNETIVQEVPEV